MLDELRPVLGSKQTTLLANRLNKTGRDRLAAMWEVAVMAPLAALGRLQHEVRLPSGKHADIIFRSDRARFFADVTTASDRGVDDRNPYRQFMDIIEEEKRALGLGVGGVRLNVYEERETVARGTRRRLRLPPIDELRNFVRAVVIPELTRQQADKRWPLAMKIDDETAGFDLTIAEGPYSSGGYGAYNLPTVVDHNPLYSALADKARKLRSCEGVCGVIVGDADCASMSNDKPGWGTFSTKQIVEGFLSEFTHVDFVMLLTVKQANRSPMGTQPRPVLEHKIWYRESAVTARDILEQLPSMMPQPVNTPANARHRAAERGFGHGDGRFEMAPPTRVKMGARPLLEVLAGKRSVADFNRSFDFAPTGERVPNKFTNPFERALAEGRLPVRITVEIGAEEDRDNVVEIEFGEPDPAISKFH